MDQSLCPYLAKPLAEIAPVNEEHVLPVAIGAPSRFFVKAAESENSRFNTLIDAPFSNEPLVRFLAMSQGVNSRSGPVVAKIPATLLSSGELVNVAFSKAGFDLKFANPIKKDAETGFVAGVLGFGDEAMKHALKVQRDYAKKNIHVNLGDVVTEHKPLLHVSLSLDNSVVWRELLKIAYLMTVWSFGDKAIDSRSGTEYRRGLNASRSQFIQIRHTTDDIPGITTKGKADSHSLMCVILGKELITSVKLFGGFAATFITEAEGVGVEGDGLHIQINAATKNLTETPVLEALMNNVRLHFEEL